MARNKLVEGTEKIREHIRREHFGRVQYNSGNIIARNKIVEGTEEIWEHIRREHFGRVLKSWEHFGGYILGDNQLFTRNFDS